MIRRSVPKRSELRVSGSFEARLVVPEVYLRCNVGNRSHSNILHPMKFSVARPGCSIRAVSKDRAGRSKYVLKRLGKVGLRNGMQVLDDGRRTHLDEEAASEEPFPRIIVVILVRPVEKSRPEVSGGLELARREVSADP